MKRRTALFAAAIAALAAPAFAQPSQSYAPGPFDRIAIFGHARVELSQGDREAVTVVGDSDAQANVMIDVSRSGELRLNTGGDWKFWSRDPLLVRIQVRELQRLTIAGFSDVVANGPIRADELRVTIAGKGDLRFANLTARGLRFDISGAGDAELGGNVDQLQLRVSGAGHVNAEKLKAREAQVVISGAGNTDLWVTDELNLVVSGPGAVTYWGSPKVRQTLSALGTVSARGEKK